MKEYTSHAVPADRDAWLDSRLESLNWMQVITLVLLDLGGNEPKFAKLLNICVST
ncbi:hypothetical protein LQQ96_24560 (plasmid) [Escherichia coli]|nr:hypothetical protein LQQ96_24560 [Escherichia coli]